MPYQWSFRSQNVSGAVLAGKLRCTVLICLIVACTGCTAVKRWAYEGFNRDAWQHPEQVVEALKIRPGESVADLGSGSGYFAFRLAKAVGRTGKVYAIDIDADMNAYVSARAREQRYENIEVVLSKPHDPLLQESSVDLIFTCNTYHHLVDRASYFANAAKYLRPSGRIAILDFNEKAWLMKFLGHATAGEVIKREMQEAGYALDQEFHFLPKQAFLIFSRNQKKAEGPHAGELWATRNVSRR